MCPKETVSAITALAVLITEKLTLEESTFLAATFVQLGDTIATIVTAKGICESK